MRVPPQTEPALLLCVSSESSVVKVFPLTRGRGIVKHAPHRHALARRIKRNFTFATTWHAITAARLKVAPRRDMQRAGHDAFDSLQPFGLDDVFDRQLRHR